MDRFRAIALRAMPVLGLALLVGILVSRRESASEAPLRAAKRTGQEDRSAYPMPQVGTLPRKPQPPPPPPPIMPSDEARIYPVYQDFRTAVALGHDAHRDALFSVLSRNRDVALHLAEQELAAAQDELGREIARKTLTALRR